MAEQLRWGWIKSWAEQNGVTDDAVVVVEVGEKEYPVLDLNHADAEEAYEDEPAVPETFLIQLVRED